MTYASTILSCTIPLKIMLDKPQITEKLTNAWHLLNIHYSDTSSEFQKAERMLNQHSYSQSEPQHHIVAHLSADENGTLGPDLKTFGDSSPGICVYVWVKKRDRGSGCLSREHSAKQGHLALFTHPPTSMSVKAIWGSWIAFYRRGNHYTQFIHNI